MSRVRWSKLRTFTHDAVKHGAAAISHTVPAQGQIGKLLRKLANEAEVPLRTAPRVYDPRPKRADNPRWSEHGAWVNGTPTPTRPAAWGERLRIAGADPAPAEPDLARAAPEARGAFAALAAALPEALLDRSANELDVGAVVAGRYEIRRMIGHGPAYRVYGARHRAWDIDVAIKVPRIDASGFRTAPRAVAADAMRWTGLGLHPHVVYCHYIDRLDDLPLLVVEHRPGGSLRPWIASGRTANLRIGLNLAVQICHGLERAHDEGLCHGGLRPENLLFGPDGTLGVGDFGIASAAALVGSEADAVPAARRRELEPYIAPEQWVDPAAIDARTDVFALGVCLYEMMTGRRPYDVARGPRREPPDPTPPVGALPPRLVALLRACVDWEPGRRPTSARAVRDELCAVHQELFRRPSPFAELPALSSDADGWNNQAVALLGLGHPDEADAVWAQALAADGGHLEATYNLGMLRWGRGQISDAALLDSVSRAGRRGDGPYAAALLAELHLRSGDVEAAIARLETVGRAALDDAGQALLDAACKRRGSGAGLLSSWTGHRAYITAVRLAEGERHVLSASDDGTLVLWTADQPTRMRTFEGHRGAVAAVAVSRDGRTAISGGDDATLRVWELKSGRCLKTLAVPGKVFSIDVSADLTRAVLACSGSANFVGVDATRLLALDLDHDRPLGELKGHTSAAKCVALSADGHLAASGSDDHTVRLWDVAQGGGCRRVFTGHEHYVSAVCLSADGGLVVSGSWDTTLRVWDTRTGRCLHVLRGHEGIINAVAINADASRVVSAGWDRTVRVWDLQTGRCIRTFGAHDGIVSCVALSADGTTAASGGWDRAVHLWRLPEHDPGGFAPRLSRRITYARLPSGDPEPDELLDTAEQALQEGRAAEALDAVRTARVHATGADAQRAVRLWTALTGVCRRSGVRALQPRAAWTAGSPLSAVQIAARSPWVVEALRGGALRVWDPELQRARWTLEGHEGRALAMAVSDDQQRVVSAAADGTVRAWDLDAGSCSHVLGGHTSVVSAVAISADARRALSGSYDHTLRLWDLERGRCERLFRGHARQVTAVAIDAEQAWAVSGDYAGCLHAWDLSDGRCLWRSTEHRAAVSALRISADGAWLLSASADRTLRLWRRATGECVAALDGHAAAVLDADLSADARWALSVARDGNAHLWDLRAARQVAVHQLTEQPLDGASVHFDAGRVSTQHSGTQAQLWDIEWELEAPALSDRQSSP